MKEILQDVKSGALPASEIPGFVFWVIRKSFWFWFVVIVIVVGVGVLLVK